MAEVGQKMRFAFECALKLIGFREGFLDRDGSTKPLVKGFIDCAHAALSERTNYSVTILKRSFVYQHPVRVSICLIELSLSERVGVCNLPVNRTRRVIHLLQKKKVG